MVLLTVVAFCFLVKLGLWQLSRAEEKAQIAQSVAEHLQQGPVALSALSQAQRAQPTGVMVHFDYTPIAGKTVLLDNQSYQGKVGYLAIQLVDVRGVDEHLLVERGWVEAKATRDVLPEVEWLREPGSMSARLYQKSFNPLSNELYYEAGNPARVQNINTEALAKQWAAPMATFIAQPTTWSMGATTGESWPYPQPWQPISMSPEKHLGYAVQWFSMALALLLIVSLLLFRTIKRTLAEVKAHHRSLDSTHKEVSHDSCR